MFSSHIILPHFLKVGASSWSNACVSYIKTMLKVTKIHSVFIFFLDGWKKEHKSGHFLMVKGMSFYINPILQATKIQSKF